MTTLERFWMCAVWGCLGLACVNDGPPSSAERATMPAFVSAGSAAELPERTDPASRAAAPEAAATPPISNTSAAGRSATPGSSLSTSAAGGAAGTASAASSGVAAGATAAAGSGETAGAAGSGATPAEPPLFPEPSTPETRIPSPDNPPECPAVAPENPIGDCVGLPVYVECNYGTYNCICDWVHWLCAG